jgi:hypothetical protein
MNTLGFGQAISAVYVYFLCSYIYIIFESATVGDPHSENILIN